LDRRDLVDRLDLVGRRVLEFGVVEATIGVAATTGAVSRARADPRLDPSMPSRAACTRSMRTSFGWTISSDLRAISACTCSHRSPPLPSTVECNSWNATSSNIASSFLSTPATLQKALRDTRTSSTILLASETVVATNRWTDSGVQGHPLSCSLSMRDRASERVGGCDTAKRTKRER
jgi:hypothetical protein